jgi:hypothetical protein
MGVKGKMNKIIITTGVVLILVFTLIPTTTAYNDEHEITDQQGDTNYEYVDVIWGSFYEKSDEPEYLFVDLKIAELKDKIGTVYAIHWSHDGVHYDVSFRNGIMIPHTVFKKWDCDRYIWRRAISTWDPESNTGSLDLESGIISWKILKSCVGNPQPGDILTQPYAFTAQRISKMGLIPLRFFFRSLCDVTSDTDGIDYIIQY